MTYCWLYTTCSNQNEAAEIAKTLVEEHLIACANIFPIVRSIYRWQGAIQDDQEAAMICKTRSDHYAEASKRLSSLHSYETPCLVKLDWKEVSAAYGQWLDEQIAPA